MQEIIRITPEGDDTEAIEVGTRVCLDGQAYPPGTVVEITDPDADVDDDTGQAIVINPVVKVRWDECEADDLDSFGTHYVGQDRHGYGDDGEPLMITFTFTTELGRRSMFGTVGDVLNHKRGKVTNARVHGPGCLGDTAADTAERVGRNA